ncbi:substrate-binding domain-containing protein [Rathayibacter sp. VKM Ac-2760]|nr:substrate-binding domain-containing protein [Rathayibacter sp. VKM Ac-2760]
MIIPRPTFDCFVEELSASGIRHVLALRTDGISPSATTDDELGDYLAVQHLADLGHRRIEIIRGPEYAPSAVHLLDGARRALGEGGDEFSPELVAGGSFSVEAGEKSAEALLELRRPPTATFAVTDHAAIGAMTAAARQGLRACRRLGRGVQRHSGRPPSTDHPQQRSCPAGPHRAEERRHAPR